MITYALASLGIIYFMNGCSKGKDIYRIKYIFPSESSGESSDSAAQIELQLLELQTLYDSVHADLNKRDDLEQIFTNYGFNNDEAIEFLWSDDSNNKRILIDDFTFFWNVYNIPDTEKFGMIQFFKQEMNKL